MMVTFSRNRHFEIDIVGVYNADNVEAKRFSALMERRYSTMTTDSGLSTATSENHFRPIRQECD
jgi:hypothetical protein